MNSLVYSKFDEVVKSKQTKRLNTYNFKKSKKENNFLFHINHGAIFYRFIWITYLYKFSLKFAVSPESQVTIVFILNPQRQIFHEKLTSITWAISYRSFVILYYATSVNDSKIYASILATDAEY